MPYKWLHCKYLGEKGEKVGKSNFFRKVDLNQWFFSKKSSDLNRDLNHDLNQRD